MRKIYLSLILLLSITCLFLAFYSFGIFNFGSISKKDEFSFYANSRKNAVNRSTYWHLAVVGNYTDQAYISEFAQGIGRAALLLNMNGGIFNKPLKITYIEPEDDNYEVSLAVQKLCETPEVAGVLGPMSASQLKTVRALTQYHALPTLAPYSPLFPELPNLNPDIFGAIYPTQLLIEPIMKQLKMMNCHNLLFISVGSDSYSSIFTNLLSKSLRNDQFFREIHRIDFIPPADANQFYQPLKRLFENSDIDAIIYTDTPENLRVLGSVMNDLKIKIPVFGNDLLSVPTLSYYVSECNFPIYYVSFKGDILPKAFAEEYIKTFEREPTIKEQLGALGCLFFHDALLKDGYYDPIRIGERFKELSVTYFTKEQHNITPYICKVNVGESANAEK